MRELSEDERRRTLEETWASFALDGYLPDDEDRRLARAYIDGSMTLSEILEETRRRFAHLTEEPPAGV